MKANEFVKEYGLDRAKEAVMNMPNDWEYCCLRIPDFEFLKRVSSIADCVDMDDLKRLVESHEIVGRCGGLDKSKLIVSKSPSNAESYQDGYYFRESPVFEFHNGIHGQWNLTENNGEYFKKRGFNPIRIDRLGAAIADVGSCS